MMIDFFRLLEIEIKKAVKNKFFWLSIILGMFFCLLSGIETVKNYLILQEQLEELKGNPMTQAFGLYNMWIGGECNSIGYVLFYSFYPLLAVLPYGFSYSMDRKIGYDKLLIIRTGRLQYFLVKYITAFICGGLVITIPLVCNFIGTACFIPAVKPSILYDIYYPVRYGSLWSELYFSQPFVFVCKYLLLDFIFAGLFGCMGILVSFFFEKVITAVFLPYFLILILHYGRTLLYGRVYKEISPLNFLHTTCIENIADAKIIFIEGAIIFLLLLLGLWKKGRKYEIR